MDISGPKSDRPLRIGLCPLPGFALMSYAATSEPFRAANLLSGRELYQLVNCADDAQITSSGAAAALTDRDFGDTGMLDYLFVIAGGDPFRFSNNAVFGWLRRLSKSGVTMGGVSGGPVILARAGLMADRRMTVHWEHAPALAETFPDLLLERTLFVIDRDRMTCAGGTAPLDMVHALIAGHHGARFARRVSDWFMHTEIRPGLGPQPGGLAERLGTTNRTVLDAVRAMGANLAEPLSLSDLARICDVTPRHVSRLFQEQLGRTPMQIYGELRMELAQKLVKDTDLPFTEIAAATGFSGLAHFSRSFSCGFGLSPTTQRKEAQRHRREAL